MEFTCESVTLKYAHDSWVVNNCLFNSVKVAAKCFLQTAMSDNKANSHTDDTVDCVLSEKGIVYLQGSNVVIGYVPCRLSDLDLAVTSLLEVIEDLLKVPNPVASSPKRVRRYSNVHEPFRQEEVYAAAKKGKADISNTEPFASPNFA